MGCGLARGRDDVAWQQMQVRDKVHRIPIAAARARPDKAWPGQGEATQRSECVRVCVRDASVANE